METKEKNHAKEQAKAQLESIVAMVKRLEHCQECDGDDVEDCELADKEILEGINLYYAEGDKATEEERKQYHNEDEAKEAIDEDPLSVEVRSDWHTPGGDDKASEYMILLCTGGPAVRIIGELDDFQQPKTAKLEYQDWFTPWETLLPLEDSEHDAILTYARQFYFGE